MDLPHLDVPPWVQIAAVISTLGFVLAFVVDVWELRDHLSRLFGRETSASEKSTSTLKGQSAVTPQCKPPIATASVSLLAGLTVGELLHEHAAEVSAADLDPDLGSDLLTDVTDLTTPVDAGFDTHTDVGGDLTDSVIDLSDWL